jgi:anti-sigma factor ChrR (cupin superfamily)
MNQRTSLLDPKDRMVTATTSAELRPYDRYGDPNPMMDWIPLSGDANLGYETFFLKIRPGAETTPHMHVGGEEFYVVDGSLTDCDGVTFHRGDYVSYQPGSRHFSMTDEGCTLLVILRGQNTVLCR